MAQDQAVAIIIVGLEFFLFYVANSIKDKDERGDVINSMRFFKIVLFGFAGFVSFISIILLQTYAEPGGVITQSGRDTLGVLYQFSIYAYLIMGSLFLFGLFVNFIYTLFYEISNKNKGGK